MNQGAHTIEFRLRSNLILVDAVLDGETMPFIVDTGASNTVIDKKVAARGVMEGIRDAVGSEACGAGGNVEAAMTRVSSLAVGGAIVSDLGVARIDLSGINEKVGAEIAGILGYDFLSRFRVTIDYREETLTLTPYPQLAA